MPSEQNNDPKGKNDKRNFDKSIETAEPDHAPHLDVETIPPNYREFFMAIRQTATRSKIHPFIEKLNDDHVHKIIDHMKAVSERQFHLERTDKNYRLIALLSGIAVFVFLAVILLPQNGELFGKILETLIIAGGGIGIGGGVAVYKLYKRKRP